MLKSPNLKIGIFFASLILMELWMVSAYGSYMGFERNKTHIFREVTRVLIPFTGLLGLLLLPRTHSPRQPWIPRPPKTLIVCFSYLFIWGGFMILNATADNDPTNWIATVYPKEERLIPALDGSHSKSASIGYLWELFGIIVFVLLITRSTQSNLWRSIVLCLSATALFVALVGIGHKAFEISTVWGIEDESSPPTFFAPFIYNANAAALMNMGLPIALAMALRSLSDKGVTERFFAWLIVAGIVFAAVLATASKAGAIILLFQVILFFIWESKTLLGFVRQRKKERKVTLEHKLVLGSLSFIFLAMTLVSVSDLSSRLIQFTETAKDDGKYDTIEGRIAVIKFTLEKSFDPEDPVWEGHGPGSFRHTYPYYLTPKDLKLAELGRFDETHSDPVQTIFEWGYLGALCWFTFGVGAVVRGIHIVVKQRVPKKDIPLIKALVISLTGVGIHSCFDFPLSLLSIHLIAVAYCAVLWTIPGTTTQLSNFKSSSRRSPS